MKKLSYSTKPVIWMIHFPPLIGYKDYPWEDYIVDKMLREIEVYEKWGIDAIMLENNYDVPHTKELPTEILVQLTKLAYIARQKTNLPLWICVLWNDWKASLSIAKMIGLDFIRIPVFVDRVQTYWFVIDPIIDEFNEYKRKIKADDIDILVDVHVKHSQILSNYSLEESVKKSIDGWANAVIITWNWTGDLPQLKEIINLKERFKNVKIIVWSGVAVQNIGSLIEYVDWFIVWTYFKTNNFGKDKVNIKSWKETIDLERVKALVREKQKYLISD